ncbi:TPA: hypothetical protein DHW58_02630 [Patescibacteria group bacterium]|uniref:Bacterial spore germination immunoglobulin-like domain-containing protein n=2 Tax=Bacteria division Kazan-3B-28 TaxID=1798534 RepID=A0A0G1X7A9_UNCK3|nr:MAG: hypothetical protein VE98_C0001G0158 [candidate division Kazan bacterium GW2011_GWA1_50_15]KKW25566.1 MAG: hypothetical protein VE99_C0001G0203 [candidate division Kazan bacterium GW2011_GWC1_52_13]KKW26871.1 MAG: hypothetical protein VF00_C0002G0196 [candidate division Kazan bacterium GW2011_GWB1_52_7]HAV65866.1 hypothetical protein [Patescibacteria group bacterium]HCL47855.1 hypothetical protein [Patescibacteria group bacterium]
MKTAIWILVLAVVVVGGAYLVDRSQQPAQPNEQSLISVQVDQPAPNATVVSPLAVSGQAVGGWYFEASFPVELLNSSNQVIATTTAQAQSDWMTTNLVPFTATLTFPAQTTGSSGTLVLRKDNPSGEPQNDDSFSVPIVF